jgi:hypothetical protein
LHGLLSNQQAVATQHEVSEGLGLAEVDNELLR